MKHVHSDHCAHPQPHDGFEPGPSTRSRRARHVLGHVDHRPRAIRDDGPMIFSGVGGYQIKGPIVFAPRTLASLGPNRNKYR